MVRWKKRLEQVRQQLFLRSGEFLYKEDSVRIHDFKTGELTKRLYDYLTGIQWGKEEDR